MAFNGCGIEQQFQYRMVQQATGYAYQNKQYMDSIPLATTNVLDAQSTRHAKKDLPVCVPLPLFVTNVNQ